jgi:outer membrane protein assembly factor BamB
MPSLTTRARFLSLGAVGALLLGSASLFGQAQEKTDAYNGPNVKPGRPPVPNVADPVAIKTKEGKTGWKVTIPGGRPLATPAVVDGKVFLGGGFGSHEFYAFDAATGKKVWLYRTGDDGPTAAVVEDGFIAFNTESCELEILTMDGKQVWKKWLGDPLMSMPAISRGRVFMAYPDSRGDRSHKLVCFDIKDGKEIWQAKIAGEIITAPVIQEGHVYLTTLEGTMYCFDENRGDLIWSDKKNATSSPAIFNGKVFFSQRSAVKAKDKDGKEFLQQMEALAGRGLGADGAIFVLPGTEHSADYLDFGKRMQYSKIEGSNQTNDAGVGFGTAPDSAKLNQAESNLGQRTVCGVWSYQGSRPFIYQGRLVSSMGDTVKSVDLEDNKVLWTTELHPNKDGKPVVDSGLTPPAVVNGKLFIGTRRGEIICLSAETGKELWRATVGEPIVFQPAVANGRVYVSSSCGTLFCIETGDRTDHGWLMWGGNAQHNGMI